MLQTCFGVLDSLNIHSGAFSPTLKYSPTKPMVPVCLGMHMLDSGSSVWGIWVGRWAPCGTTWPKFNLIDLTKQDPDVHVATKSYTAFCCVFWVEAVLGPAGASKAGLSDLQNQM